MSHDRSRPAARDIHMDGHRGSRPVPVHLRGVQRLPVRVRIGQRLRELHEPEAHRTGRYRAPERKTAYLLHGVLRLAGHQAARAWQNLGGRVPETLRHIEVILRQAP